MSLDRVLRNSKLIYFLKDVKQIITKKGNHWSLRWAWNEFGDMLGRGWIISKITSNSLLVPKQNIGKTPSFLQTQTYFQNNYLNKQQRERTHINNDWSLDRDCSEFAQSLALKIHFFQGKLEKKRNQRTKPVCTEFGVSLPKVIFFQKRVKRNPQKNNK